MLCMVWFIKISHSWCMEDEGVEALVSRYFISSQKSTGGWDHRLHIYLQSHNNFCIVKTQKEGSQITSQDYSCFSWLYRAKVRYFIFENDELKHCCLEIWGHYSAGCLSWPVAYSGQPPCVRSVGHFIFYILIYHSVSLVNGFIQREIYSHLIDMGAQCQSWIRIDCLMLFIIML